MTIQKSLNNIRKKWSTAQAPADLAILLDTLKVAVDALNELENIIKERESTPDIQQFVTVAEMESVIWKTLADIKQKLEV